MMSHGSTDDVTDSHAENNMALIHACAAGAFSSMDSLLHLGADANTKEKHGAGDSCLTLATRQGHWRIVESLLSSGATTEHRNSYRDTALLIASRDGHSMVVDALLNARAVSEVMDVEGNSPVMLASRQGHVDVVTSLVKAGVKVNRANVEGETALMLASFGGHKGIADCLLRHGANLEAKTSEGDTAIQYAVLGSQAEMVKYLLDQNACFALCNNWPPLIAACYRGYSTVVNTLLTSRSIELLTRWPTHGSMALMKAGDERTVKILLKAGVDINTQNYHGQRTPLRHSVLGADDIKTLLLLQFGADPNKLPVLLQACERATVNEKAEKRIAMANIVKCLLDYGADVNVQDPSDIEYLCQRAQSLPCLSNLNGKPLLLASGDVTLHAADDIGRTPLSALCLKDDCCLKVVEELLKGGAIIGANFHRVVLAGLKSCIPLMMKSGALPTLHPFSHIKHKWGKSVPGNFQDAHLSPLAAALLSNRLDIAKYLVSNHFLHQFDIKYLGHCKVITQFLKENGFDGPLGYLTEMTSRPWPLYALSFVETSHVMTLDIAMRRKLISRSGLPPGLQRRLLFEDVHDFV